MTAHRAAFKRWSESIPKPKAPKNPRIRLKAVEPTPTQLAKLAEVLTSRSAPAEAVRQRMTPQILVGTLYSAFAAYEFMRMLSERRRLERSPRRATLERQWNEVVRAMQTAFRIGGLEVTERDLVRYAKNVASSKAVLDAIAAAANSAETVKAPSTLSDRLRPYMDIIPDVEKYLGPHDTIVVDGHFCDEPFANGTYSKHFSYGVKLCIPAFPYPCPTWSKPWKWCTKKVCVGASFSLTLDIGYQADCCGASAWGVAYADACASIAGQDVCASCSAVIDGVAGIARTPLQDGSCNYGLGVVATLSCEFAGLNIFKASVPYGWTLQGQCPPEGFVCP